MRSHYGNASAQNPDGHFRAMAVNTGNPMLENKTMVLLRDPAVHLHCGFADLPLSMGHLSCTVSFVGSKKHAGSRSLYPLVSALLALGRCSRGIRSCASWPTGAIPFHVHSCQDAFAGRLGQGP